MRIPQGFSRMALGAALALAMQGCSSGDNKGNQDEGQELSTPAPPPAPPPSPPTPTQPPVEPAPPPTGANGCSSMNLPGHSEGEGLAKHWVPGPVVKLCPPPSAIAPATATPVAAVPAQPVATAVPTAGPS